MNSHGGKRHSRAVIDLNAIRHNYALLKQLAGGKRLIAVIKADAYGHGAFQVASALAHADAFAVASVGEAVALREAGIQQKILVLGGFIRFDELKTCIDNKLDPVIHQFDHLQHLKNCNNLDGLQVWVKVDSGMGRLGYQPRRVAEVLDQLDRMPGLGTVRLMTHLASADDAGSEFSQKQLEAINALQLQGYEWGIANSAGILGWPQAHNAWARAGIALYGANPMSDRKQKIVDLKPAMQMKTRVLAVNPHKQGDFIGYSNTYCCSRDMRIAVVACGYADGYPRLKIETAQVAIHGKLCDIVGRVSMDMITVDVSALDKVETDDEVTLFGDQPHVNDIADSSQTIAYEVLCNVGGHVKREYIE